MSGKYAGERYDPWAIRPSHLMLDFNGKKLKLTFEDNTFKEYAAVSGNSNNDAIPEGKYWINPIEMRSFDVVDISGAARYTKDFWSHYIKSDDSLSETKKKLDNLCDSWGSHRITIHPYLETDTNGRGGFFIHGGTVPGSAGCIDLAWHMSEFVRDLTNKTSLKDCYIELNVKYS